MSWGGERRWRANSKWSEGRRNCRGRWRARTASQMGEREAKKKGPWKINQVPISQNLLQLTGPLFTFLLFSLLSSFLDSKTLSINNSTVSNRETRYYARLLKGYNNVNVLRRQCPNLNKSNNY
jgi:hypothetical protein